MTIAILFRRALRDQRRSLLGWTLGMGAYALLLASFWPTVQASAEQFQELLEAYPPALRALIGDISEFATPAGYLTAEIFSLMAPLLLLIFAIGRGASAVAGEEERGTIEVHLGLPIRRRDFVLGQALALAAALAALCAVILLALGAGAFAFGIGIGFGYLASGVLMLFLLLLVYGYVALAVGAAVGTRAAAIAAAAGAAAVSYLLESLGQIVDWLDPWRALSPWHYYLGAKPLVNGPDPLHVLVFVALAGLALVAGIAAFERRDIRR